MASAAPGLEPTGAVQCALRLRAGDSREAGHWRRPPASVSEGDTTRTSGPRRYRCLRRVARQADPGCGEADVPATLAFMATPREVEIEANGLTFETLVAGPESGETVILLHGYPQSAGSWSDTMEWLAGLGYQSIAPNLRGYSPGANPRDASEYRMTDLVADVIGIADARGVDRFHIVGHDWGGALAWSVAGDHPQRLLSLTSISTPHGAAMLEAMRTSTQSLRSVYMGFFRIPRVPEAIMQFANYRQLGLSLRATGLPSASWKRDSQQLRRVGMRGPLNWYRGATKGLRPRKISVPTLYVWGRRDPFLGRKAAELTAKYVTGPYRFEVLKAGHWIPDNNTAELRRILGEHLEDFAAPAEPVRRAAKAAAAASAERAPAKAAATASEERAPAKAAATASEERAPAKAEPAKAAAKRATAKPPKAAAPKSAAKRAPRKRGSKPPS